MKKELFGFFTAMGLCAAAGPASATVFYIDEFTVTENGVTYWNDTFTNGIAPKDQDIESPAAVDVNKYDRAYLTRPYDYLPGPETGGKLVGNLRVRHDNHFSQGNTNIWPAQSWPFLLLQAER